MKRREFITLLGGTAATWPLAAGAQQPERMRHIGVLNPFGETDQAAQANITAFRQALQKLGWTEGRNVRSDYRWGGADAGRIRAQAIELVSLNPDVILASTSLALQPLQQETRSIPIVVVQITDPVGSGFVESLARPGDNITGFTVAEFSMFGKDVTPLVTRVGVVLNPDQASQLGMWRAIEGAAPAFKVQLTPAGVRDVAGSSGPSICSHASRILA
jgi:putative ABC transport system substrate-binding protein